MVIDPSFWRGQKVFLTGHTGFKGAWTALVLRLLGAEVTGFALPPENERGIFAVAGIAQDVSHLIGDLRDISATRSAINRTRAEIVIHMGAQSLVRRSYSQPIETYATNVMGTAHVLEAVRQSSSVQAVVVITSDKCYENTESRQGYEEDDALGGYDPYSNSKSSAELVTDAYRRSFFRGHLQSLHRLGARGKCHWRRRLGGRSSSPRCNAGLFRRQPAASAKSRFCSSLAIRARSHPGLSFAGRTISYDRPGRC